MAAEVVHGVRADDTELLIAKALVSFTPTFENFRGELMQGYVECVGSNKDKLNMMALYKQPFEEKKA